MLHIRPLPLLSTSSGLSLLLALSGDLCPDAVPHLSHLGLDLFLSPGYDVFLALGSCNSS